MLRQQQSHRYLGPVPRSRSRENGAGIRLDGAQLAVIKRSLSPGFAGIPNPLFSADNTLMFFEDGKKAILDLVGAVKEF